MIRGNEASLSHSYSDGIVHKKIAILGITPPPIGGISVHLQRVVHKLRQQKNHVVVFDMEKRAKGRWGFAKHWFALLFFIVKERPDYVYHHTATCFFNGRLLELPLLIVLKWVIRYKLIFVDHVSRFFSVQPRWYANVLNRLFLCADKQVLIGKATFNAYQCHGIKLGKNYSVEAAFLPPVLTTKEAIIASYPSSLRSFVASQSPVLLVNASKLALWNGVDLYGFDMALDLIERIKVDCPNAGLVLALAQQGDAAYFACIRTRVNTNNAVYLLYQCQQELWPLFTLSDVFVRPTLSDGASVSVAEALYLKVPVIASDACPRPNNVILFKARNSNDLYQKTLAVLKERERVWCEDENRKADIDQRSTYCNTQSNR